MIDDKLVYDEWVTQKIKPVFNCTVCGHKIINHQMNVNKTVKPEESNNSYDSD